MPRFHTATTAELLERFVVDKLILEQFEREAIELLFVAAADPLTD